MIPGTSPQLDANLAYVQGDTWGGIPSITVTPAPIYTVDSALFAIKRSPSDIQTLELTTSNGDVIIVDSANWVFSIPPQQLPIGAGNYVWQFRIKDSNGSLQTYLQGNLNVLVRYSQSA